MCAVGGVLFKDAETVAKTSIDSLRDLLPKQLQAPFHFELLLKNKISPFPADTWEVSRLHPDETTW
jgi:hypothetical protein